MIVVASERAQLQAAELVSRGGLIAFRTDTFYGLGADPFNAEAIGAIRQLKGTEEAKPILVLIADLRDVDRLIAEKPLLFDRVCERYWPGPLTLVGPAHRELPRELTAGTATIGVRLPDETKVRRLVRACGGALTATSANPSGKPPARLAAEVEAYFPAGIDLIIDGGEVTSRQPSTVLDLTGPQPRVIREGAISRSELQQAVREFSLG